MHLSLRLFLAVSFACASQGVLIEEQGAMTTKAGVITLTQYNIDSMMGKYNYLMVNFCASWKKGCKVTEADFEKAAARLKQDNVGKDIALAYVNLTVAKALGRKFEITKVPQLKLFTTFGSETGLSVKFSAYKGKKDADAIYNHAKTTMDEAREGSNILRAEKKEGKITDEKKRAAYISVKEATAENFKQLIGNPKEDVLLQLYDNKPLSAKLAPEYKQLAEMFQTAGIKTVRFTKLDVTTAGDLAALHPALAGIKASYPALLLFTAKDKKKPVAHKRRPAMKQIAQFLADKASIKFEFDMATAFDLKGSAADAKKEEEAPAAAEPAEELSDEDFDL